jgi:hypothetical protein
MNGLLIRCRSTAGQRSVRVGAWGKHIVAGAGQELVDPVLISDRQVGHRYMVGHGSAARVRFGYVTRCAVVVWSRPGTGAPSRPPASLTLQECAGDTNI